MSQPSPEEIALFKELINEYRFNLRKLAYIIFPFGEKGTDWEHVHPYEWQLEELDKLSMHLLNPATRYETYRLIVSSGNGAAKTALGSMIMVMLLYTQRLKARLTANTDPQMKQIVWPEVDKWFRAARYNEHFFEKLGTSIKARNETLAENWRADTVTWSEQTPQAISGLHNKGGAVMYWFEEAPGIPANIWSYASGAFTETETIKVFMAFGNSDDPESMFEQNMKSSLWHSRRIDTRTLSHIDPNQIKAWLEECGGNEDHDDFRVRVRGLPRKAAKDSIINFEAVCAALERRHDFDPVTVADLPGILSVDPAWTGGDETTIWYHRGNYSKLLERYVLDKAAGDTHMLTYTKLCHYERELQIDAVFIDQAEGTTVYTLAINAGKTSWELIAFGSGANDAVDTASSEYANMRAMMYYEAGKHMFRGAVLDAAKPEWIEDIKKQLCWTKGTRHKITGKKIAESKKEIKDRVGQSPDIADGYILRLGRPVFEKLPEHQGIYGDERVTGGQAWTMPGYEDPYTDISVPEGLYDQRR